MALTNNKKLPNDIGYSLDYKLNSYELNYFKDAISDQWLKRINKVDKNLGLKLVKNNQSITKYHEISKEINHSEVWRKSDRILDKSFSCWFLNSEFAGKLKKNFGEFTISDEDNLGWPNIYWRLVRPKEETDVGPIHRDSWFWELNDQFPKPSYDFYRLKVWLAIFVETGLNGLLVEPSSQYRSDIKWKGEDRHGIKKPVLITPNEQIRTILLKTIPGQAIVFNDELLHGGSLNRGNNCRVSVEFTMLLKS